MTDFLVGLLLGDHRLRCPQCNRGKRDTALAVTVQSDGTVWFCHRCGFKGAQKDKVYSYKAGRPQPKLVPKRNLTLASEFREYWKTLTPIQGTALSYLDARGCASLPRDSHLRCTESLRHRAGYVGPALVGLVTDAVTREPLTLHRTWIRSDGSKADVDPARMLLGNHPKVGGVIRLWPDDAVTTALAIGEGIETALTVALAFKPVWSLIDAGNLAKFPVLEGIESLVIAADNDEVGLRASEQCADRWYRAGREVRIIKPPVQGQDFNDFIRSAA